MASATATCALVVTIIAAKPPLRFSRRRSIPASLGAVATSLSVSCRGTVMFNLQRRRQVLKRTLVNRTSARWVLRPVPSARVRL